MKKKEFTEHTFPIDDPLNKDDINKFPRRSSHIINQETGEVDGHPIYETHAVEILRNGQVRRKVIGYSYSLDGERLPETD